MSETVDPELIEHDQRCRLCLVPFDEWIYKKRLLRMSVVKRIYDLVKIKLLVRENLSRNICEVCLLKIREFERFTDMISANQKRCLEFERTMKPFVALEMLDEVPMHFMQSVTKEEELDEEFEIKEEPLDFTNEDDSYGQTDSWCDQNVFVADGFLTTVDIKPEKSEEIETESEVAEKPVKTKPKAPSKKRVRPREYYRRSDVRERKKFVQNVRKRVLKKPYTCPYCEEYITENLNGHIFEHTNKKKNLLYCDICDFNTLRKPRMRGHMEWHAKYTFKCAFCTISFPLKRERTVHEMEFHAKKLDDGRLECPCGAKTVHKASWDRHYLKAHSLMLNVSCKKCKKKFTDSKLLKQHYKDEHSDYQPCIFCGIMVEGCKMNLHTFQKHTTHKCEVEGCNLEFPTRGRYLYHLRYHDEKASACPQCGAEFSNELKMQEHIRRQHQTMFYCQVPGCKHKTVIKYRLARHYINSKHHRKLLPEERVNYIALLKINPSTCKTIHQYYLTGVGEPPRAKLLSVLP